MHSVVNHSIVMLEGMGEGRHLPTYLMGYSLQFVTDSTAWKTSEEKEVDAAV